MIAINVLLLEKIDAKRRHAFLRRMIEAFMFRNNLAFLVVLWQAFRHSIGSTSVQWYSRLNHIKRVEHKVIVPE